MRIAYDHQIFGWQVYGGISRYICELARIMTVDLGQVAKIFAPLFINRHLLEGSGAIPLEGRLVPRLPGCGRLYRRINNLLAAPALAAFRPDIVHETYYAASRQAPQGARLVLTVHDMIHERFHDQHSRFDPTRREKARAVARADRVICASENTRRDLLELMDVDPAKLTVVHHGFTQQPPVSSAQSGSQNAGRPFLLYVGLRSGYKNFLGLLRAYASSPMLRNEFDLVCFGGKPLADAERQEIRRLGLGEDRVRQISGRDEILTALYGSARAFIYPSLYEGFGIPPLEAMSQDCPVACANTSSLPEVVGDAAALFDPNDVDAMRCAIEKVVGDEALRLSLIAQGRRRAALFPWTRCAEQTLKVYQELLGGGG